MVARHHNEAVRREEFGPVNVARAERAGAVREDDERPLARAPERYLLRRLTHQGGVGSNPAYQPTISAEINFETCCKFCTEFERF